MYNKLPLFSFLKKTNTLYKYIYINSIVNMSIDIGDMRTKYKNKSEAFLEDDIIVKEPINQFKTWFDEVKNNPTIIEPNAMCLATSTKDGIPSARFVLLKGYGKDGFKFFTNYDSRKGKELNENPHAALTFYWDILNRSIRIEGCVEKLDLSEAEEYFQRRPKQSQIGACSSKQSTVIAGRHILTEKEQELCNMYKESKVPRPENWGGYILIPNMIEFWQGQTDRLHDRIRFRKPKDGEKINQDSHKGENGWVYERLAP